jgi:hypothetical protein
LQQADGNAENELEPAHNINKDSRFERETLQHLQTLVDHASNLEEVLETFGTRIKRRRNDLAAYRKILDKAIHFLRTDISEYKSGNLDPILAFIKLAQAGEDNDVEIWRQLDAERQSTLITVERLQKLVGPKKKKVNQRNKNKSSEEEGDTKGEGGTRGKGGTRGGRGGSLRSSGMSRQWPCATAIHCSPQCSGSTYYGWSQGLEITMSRVAQWVC